MPSHPIDSLRSDAAQAASPPVSLTYPALPADYGAAPMSEERKAALVAYWQEVFTGESQPAPLLIPA